MSSITTAVAADYRLQQWAQLVKECQNRPSDMTVEQWCDTKGISKSNYYYRLRRIRKACLEHIPEDTYTPSLFEKNFILPKEREEGIAGNLLF